MKRTVITLALLCFSPALAHETVNAGNVQLEWHTDTNEWLQAQGDSTLTLSLKVNGRLLKASDCRCTILLYAGEVNPRVKPSLLTSVQAEEGTLETVITVPKAGTYSVVIDAKPVPVNLFTAFRTTIKLEALDDVYNVPVKK